MKKSVMNWSLLYLSLSSIVLQFSTLATPQNGLCSSSLGALCSLTKKISGIEDTTETTLNKVCTIDSKVDGIDVDLNACCFTVNSKLDVLLDDVGNIVAGSCDLTTVNSKLDIADEKLDTIDSK